MNRRDFLKVIGADRDQVEYLPVACLLRSGYGCAGYFNTTLNQSLDEMVTFLNLRIVSLRKSGQNQVIKDFNEFLEYVVQQYFQSDGQAEYDTTPEEYGKSIPLASIPLSEIAVLYPVSRIGQIMRSASTELVVTQPIVPENLQIPKPRNLRQAATSAATPKAPSMASASSTASSSSASSSSVSPTASAEPSPASPKTKASEAPKPRKVIHQSDAKKHMEDLPRFLDFDRRSVVLKALRTKLW